MAKKKRAPTKAKTGTVYHTAPSKRFHKKSNATYIPSAGATVGLAYANKDVILSALNDISFNGAKNAFQQAIQPAQLKKSALFAIGGMVAGEAVKRYAPRIIKDPVGKVAKKIPKVL